MTLFEFQKQSTHSFSLSSQYVPNDYAFMLAKEFPECFYAIGSVNPYRDDALAELQRCAQNGVTIIKWLVSYSSYVNSIQGTRSVQLSLLSHVELDYTSLFLQPNSMGIDPSDEKCVPFYEKMKELDMVSLR